MILKLLRLKGFSNWIVATDTLHGFLSLPLETTDKWDHFVLTSLLKQTAEADLHWMTESGKHSLFQFSVLSVTQKKCIKSLVSVIFLSDNSHVLGHRLS